jgi:hypothetical protein
MTTIDGFTLSIPGTELIQMCGDKAHSLHLRLGQLHQSLEKVESMSEEDRELAGFKTRGGDMADEVKKKIKDAKRDFDFFSFAVEHLEREATYRLDTQQLRFLGISLSYR